MELRCDYDLAGEPLYSLKWYKDNIEFYRWMPREVPPTRTFPVPGTEVSLTGSDDQAVKLLNLSLASSGLYQCEVSTEAPKFKTVAADAVMSVVQPPSQGPRLHWINSGQTRRSRKEGKQAASPGDRIVVTCSSQGSVPAANLKFYINNEIANNRNVETVNPRNNREDLLKTSRKELDIVLERRHFRYKGFQHKHNEQTISRHPSETSERFSADCQYFQLWFPRNKMYFGNLRCLLPVCSDDVCWIR